MSRVKGLEKIISNFTLSRGYTSNLSMNGFTSALNYQDISRYGYPSFYDTISRTLYPTSFVPNISIGEQFAPLIGIDVAFTNQLQMRFDYAKSRQLSLSLIDFS